MSIKVGTRIIAGAPREVQWGGIEGNIEDQVDLKQLLNEKLDKEDAELTGTPTAPTPSVGLSNNQIATTKFVNDAISAAGEIPPMTGHSGEFLSTDGSVAVWAEFNNNYRSDYDTSGVTQYYEGDIVKYNSEFYEALDDNLNVLPTNTSHWLKISNDGKVNYNSISTNSEKTIGLIDSSNNSGEIYYPSSNSPTVNTSTGVLTASQGIISKTENQSENSNKVATTSWVATKLENYQASLTEGTGIDITNNVISIDTTSATAKASASDFGLVKVDDTTIKANDGVISFNNNAGYITANSPALTGTPTAPTASAGTNTTQIATTAFVTNAISNYNPYPTQSGNSGKYLTTDGDSVSWATVDALPSQTGNSGKYLTTNGTTASWGDTSTATAVSIKTINGTSIIGSGDISTTELPSQSGNAGKLLSTDGNDVSWVDLSSVTSTYIHEQGTASATWNIQHNLNRYPAVSVVDSSGNEVIPEVTYSDSNNIVITMTSAFKGKAYLN